MAEVQSFHSEVSSKEIQYREAPHNIEAEQALLGAILVNNDAYYRVSDFLELQHFYEPLHRKIYEIISSMIKSGKIANPITLRTFLNDLDLGGFTAPQYVARLAAEATTVINAADYGRAIYDLAIRRQLITIGEDIVNVAYDAPVDSPPRTQIEDAEKKLYDLAETGRYDGGFLAFSDALSGAIEMAAAAFKREGKLSGISTGLSDLDNMMGGLQPSDLIILAGRPAMGKTSLATNIGFNIAKLYQSEKQQDGSIKTINGGIVGFFSLEMSADQLATRMIAEQAEIPSYKIRRGDILDEEFTRIADTARLMHSMPFYIDQTGGLSIAQLAARARRLKRQKGLDVLIIDYLQLLVGSSKRGDNRVQEMTEITTSLKALAKELNVPVIALSQLSRQVETRDDKRPQLSDLRESGSIEQDADMVLFVYRDEYYIRMREPKTGTEEYLKWQSDMELAHGKAEIIIGKQRHGPTGTVHVAFDANVTRFSDLAKEDHLPVQY